jgi:ATP-dependent Clp protease adaptor protein ClpS
MIVGIIVHVSFSLYPAGDRSCIYKGRCQSLAIPMALSAAAPGKGGVLDRPVEKTTPGRQSEFDVK